VFGPRNASTSAHVGQSFFAYSSNYLIDVEHAIIVDVEATTSIRQAEVLAASRMIERYGSLRPLSCAAQRRRRPYGSVEMLGRILPIVFQFANDHQEIAP
jgi:hypothetical protein